MTKNMMSEKLFSITQNNHVHFFYDGNEYYEKFIAMIRDAKINIHLQTYIFEMDIFGSRVHAELIHAAQRGVQVYVLIDGFGSKDFSKEAERQLVDSGVFFQRFNSIQLKWLYRWGRRLHHKILLVDQQEAIVGGMNIFSSPISHSDFPRLDFAVALKGPVTTHLFNYCQNLFTKSHPKFTRALTAKNFSPFSDGCEVGISINDWSFRRSKITAQYIRIAKEAKEQITIINSYFFPRKKFMKQLAQAAERGVRVRLILPQESDWPSYILASEYLYDYFLKRGVEIYQWKKSILHGKLATVDQTWTTIGSFNLNYTSYQQNLEMNVDIYSRKFTKYINQEIENIINSGCEKLDANNFLEKASFRKRSARFFSYVALALIANFSVGLSFQEDGIPENRIRNIARIIGAIFFLMLGLIGIIIPVIPAGPFFLISFLLIYKQLLLNKKKA